MRPFDFVVHSGMRHPDKVAIAHKGRNVTYADLASRVLRLASVMKNRCGVRAGDCVGIWCTNCPEYIEALLAIQVIGAVPDMYNVRFSCETVLSLMAESRIGLAFVGGHDDVLDEGVEKIRFRSGARIVSIGASRPGCDDFERFLELGDACVPCEGGDDDVAMQLYTSGTTGMPKCVQLTYKNVVACAVMGTRETGIRHDDVMLVSFPLYHAAGLVLASVFLVGAKVVMGGVRTDEIASLVSRYGISCIALPPTIIQRLVAYADEHELDFSCVRTIMYGASRMTPDLIEKSRARFGDNVGFFQMYGMTETCASLTALVPEDHLDPSLLTTVGRPLLGVRIRIVDEGGGEVPACSIGEICARSDTLMKGYRGNPGLTRSVVSDGWYHTHDMGYIDERGYLHLTGRKDRMIISGGENIFPEEVEKCISGMRGVSETFVLGQDDPEWGQRVVAFVVREDGAEIDEEAVIRWCAENLAHYKKPRRVIFVDALPRTDLGKVLGKRLQERLE